MIVDDEGFAESSMHGQRRRLILLSQSLGRKNRAHHHIPGCPRIMAKSSQGFFEGGCGGCPFFLLNAKARGDGGGFRRQHFPQSLDVGQSGVIADLGQGIGHQQ